MVSSFWVVFWDLFELDADGAWGWTIMAGMKMSGAKVGERMRMYQPRFAGLSMAQHRVLVGVCLLYTHFVRALSNESGRELTMSCSMSSSSVRNRSRITCFDEWSLPTCRYFRLALDLFRYVDPRVLEDTGTV